MSRHTRYQGLIIQDHKTLLIRHSQHSKGRSYWVIPGGRIEGSESAEECVIREMKEETNLLVKIERLVIGEPALPDGIYKWTKSFICTPISGGASPGYEPEPEAAADYSISTARLFDLRDDIDWSEYLLHDPFTYPQFMKLRHVLGYLS